MAGILDFFNPPVEAGTGNTQSFGGILSDALAQAQTNPFFNIGIGLLSADDFGPGLAQGIALQQQNQNFVTDRETQRLKNEAAREELRRQARQDAARRRLLQEGQPVQPGQGRGFGLLSPSGMSDRGTLDFSQDIGLLADAAPELVFGEEGLLSQQMGTGGVSVPFGDQQIPFDDLPNDTKQAFIQESLVRGGNIDLSNPEVTRAISERIGSIRGTEGAMETIALQQAAIEAQKLRAEAQQEQLSAENAQLKRGKLLKDSAQTALDLSRTARNLQGTAAEPGGFELTRQSIDILGQLDSYAPEVLQSAIGVNAREAQRLSGLMQTFTRLSKGQLVQTLKELSEFDINPTDAKLGAMAQLTPSLTNRPEDNFRNMLDILRGVRDSVQSTPGEQFGDDQVEKEIQAEIDILERELGLKGTGSTVNPPPSRKQPILTLPGGTSLENFRSE